LLQNPKLERTLYAGRARFDVIVYYDQNSKNLDSLSMMAVKNVLESQQLRRSPMLLVGGFDAWQSIIGEGGVYRFPIALKEKKHWLRNNKSNSSFTSTASNEHENKSLYDYVSIFK
jgi:hypothetical protein